MTKEMRPTHCVGVLVHALLYYGRQKKDKLGTYVEQVMGCYVNINCLLISNVLFPSENYFWALVMVS